MAKRVHKTVLEKYAERKERDAEQYEKHKENMAQRTRDMSNAGREIGDIYPPVNPERRELCRNSLRSFCESYFKEVFYLRFSDDHLRVIESLETCIKNSGQFAMAMPRGSGKTNLVQAAALWAILYGYRKCCMIVGATQPSSIQMLSNIKMVLEVNELLYEDFPEICVAARGLKGITQKARGMLYLGNPIHFEWSSDEIAFPYIDGYECSGGLIVARAITGAIKGYQRAHPSGGSIRPDVVIIDDPQTRESASSASQCASRITTINSDIIGLAGPGKQCAAFLTCTVFYQGDLADEIMNPDKHPAWTSERIPFLYSMPKNVRLWDQYSEIYFDGIRKKDNNKAANAFYKENQAAMDDGASVYWPDRFSQNEVSAIQCAMNLRFKDELAFFSEYQNAPKEEVSMQDRLTVEEVGSKLNRRDRFKVPSDANRLVMFIDVQGECLFYVITAWADGFTGYIVDYGTYPDQQMNYFGINELRKKLSDTIKDGREAAWYKGLETLCELKLDQEWSRDDGNNMKIDRCLVDANDGNAADTIFRFAKQCKWPAVVMPARGQAVGATNKPFSEWKRNVGDRVGLNWRVPAGNKKGQRFVISDVNFWKSFVRQRWKVGMGGKGCLSLFGTSPVAHRMFIDQQCSELSTRVEGLGRVVDVWKALPGHENHYWDCVVGCAIAASEQGINIDGVSGSPVKKKERISLAELQRQNRMKRG